MDNDDVNDTVDDGNETVVDKRIETAEAIRFEVKDDKESKEGGFECEEEHTSSVVQHPHVIELAAVKTDSAKPAALARAACPRHPLKPIAGFCSFCKVPICFLCVSDHARHPDRVEVWIGQTAADDANAGGPELPRPKSMSQRILEMVAEAELGLEEQEKRLSVIPHVLTNGETITFHEKAAVQSAIDKSAAAACVPLSGALNDVTSLCEVCKGPGFHPADFRCLDCGSIGMCAALADAHKISQLFKNHRVVTNTRNWVSSNN